MIKKIAKSLRFKFLSLRIHLLSVVDKKQLKKVGFRKLLFKGWNPKTLRRYYIGSINKNDCFIKITNRDSASMNELYVLKKIQKFNCSFIPSVYYMDDSFNKKTLLATSVCSNNKLESFIITKTAFDNCCKRILNILNAFYKIGFVHGDIHKGNLLINNKNEITIIDFGIGTFIDDNQEIDYKTHYGTYFLVLKVGEKTIRRYDDAYSFVQTLKSLPIETRWLESKEYLKITKMIGRLYFDVEI